MTKDLTYDILDLIGVEPPYFTLAHIYPKKEHLYANIEFEQSSSYEQDAICAAEVGRHLAILGACYSAHTYSQTSRGMYLAQKAILHRLTQNNISPNDSYYGTANGTKISNKNYQATCYLYSNNNSDPLYLLEITYLRVSYSSFFKLFGSHIYDGPINKNFRYSILIPIEHVVVDDNMFMADISHVSPDFCLGHFNKIYALPISILMYNLSLLSSLLVHHVLGNKAKLNVLKADITSKSLVFSGMGVSLKARLIKVDGAIFTLFNEAVRSDGKVAGTMELTLQVADSSLLSATVSSGDSVSFSSY